VQEFDPTGILEEVDEINENEDADRESRMTDHPDMELDEFSAETVDNSAEEKNYDVFEKFSSISGINEIDDNSAEPLEEVYIISIIFVYCPIYNYFSEIISLSTSIILFILHNDIFFIINAFLSDRR